jgi:hypothetical protein
MLEMKKIAIAVMALALAACGKIETGNAGLRTTYTGKVEQEPIGQGFYTKFTSTVTEYTLKKIPVVLENMTPKVAGGLRLKELDVQVIYQINPASLYRLTTQYTGMDAIDPNDGDIRWPAYQRVKAVSLSEIANVVSQFDSMEIHQKRNAIENEAKTAIQKALDASDPGAFTIVEVIVKQVLTDESVENAIRNVATKQKENEAALLEVSIAKRRAEAVAATANTLTPAFLQHEYNQALAKFADNKNVTVVLDGSGSAKMLNIKQ